MAFGTDLERQMRQGAKSDAKPQETHNDSLGGR